MRWGAAKSPTPRGRRFSTRLGVRGASLIEVAVTLVLASLVLGAAYAVLIAQRRFYTLTVQTTTARDAARIALQVLSGELRGSSPAAGDLYAMDADSLAVRSTTAAAVLCDVAGTTLHLRRLAGAFGDRPADSALVYLEGDTSVAADDAWVAVRVLAVGGGGTGSCPDQRPPDLGLIIDRTVGGVLVGAPVRGFRPYIYKLYSGPDGRWWLGQRLRGGIIQPVTGPFAAPGSGGLRFEYLTASGVPAAELRGVAQVRIEVRGSRPGASLRRGARVTSLGYDLSTVVYVRNR